MDNAIVRVEGIVKVFGGQVRALDGISLAVEPGIIYGLLGPNGPARPPSSACSPPYCRPMRAQRTLPASTSAASRRRPRPAWAWCRKISPFILTSRRARTWSSGARCTVCAALKTWVREESALVTAFYDQKATFPARSEGRLLVAQAVGSIRPSTWISKDISQTHIFSMSQGFALVPLFAAAGRAAPTADSAESLNH